MQKIALADLSAYVQKLLQLPVFVIQTEQADQKDHALLITLVGDLGAGKTTFVQALAKELGVTESVLSPTYVIMKSYDIPAANQNRNTEQTISARRFAKLVHIDLYRLDKPEELSALKLGAVLADPANLVCIEWPERAGTLLPRPDLHLHLSSDGASEAERFVEIIQG